MTTAVATRAAPPASRMTIASVERGVKPKPRRILLIGVEGVGKSTFGAAAPNPVFICPEDGLTHLDVPHFPEPSSWADVLGCVEALRTEPHDFKTAVFDTVDWIEPLLWKFICERDKQENIEAYGYGKGYVAALDEWRLFLRRLEALRRERGLDIVLLAHSWVKQFKNPEGEDYDRYQMKLHDKSAGLLREWCDVVMFANYETATTTDKRTKRVRGISTGARVMYTERSAAFDAKNRLNLPWQLPLDWQSLEDAIAANRVADPETLRASIAELLTGCTDDKLKATVEATVAARATDAPYLARVLNKLAATLPAQPKETPQ
jgi:hypothetical protein